MKGTLADPDNYNWLYHQQLVRGDSEAFFELSNSVEQKLGLDILLNIS